jgi:hypothetical protein
MRKPTYVPPLHKYRYNGKAFVYRKHSWAFLAVLITFVTLSVLAPEQPNVEAHEARIVGLVLSGYSDELKALEQEKAKEIEHRGVAHYIKKTNPALTDDDALSFARYAVEAANTFKLKLPVFLALIKHESGFKPEIASNMGAMGLTQVIPKWHHERIAEARKLLNAYSIYEPKLNLYVGAWALSDFIKESRNLEEGLLRYNGSLDDPSRIYAKTVLAEAFNINNILTAQKL